MSETIMGWQRRAVEVHVRKDAPCPFCGSIDLLFESHCDTVIISCRDCLAVGPVTAGQRMSHAWARWNTRDRLASDEAEEFVCTCRDLPHLPVDFSGWAFS